MTTSDSPAEAPAPRRRRGEARARKHAARAARVREPLPALERRIPPYDMVDPDLIETIHEASMALLEDPGIEFRDDEALSQWRSAGADVREQRVLIPRELLLALVAKAPAQFVVHARNPQRGVRIGGPFSVFAPSYGAPNVRDLDGVRRYATLADLQMFHKLAHMSPALHNVGFVSCEPMDVPVPWRHLHIAHSCLLHSDKPFMGSVTSGERARDTVAMAEIVFGSAFLREHTVMVSVINCNSPLVWDRTMLEAMRVYCSHNQAVLCSPFVLGGASTSASVAASVAQLNAEALAGIAYGQLVRPGCPTVYGNYLSTVSMKSGAPMNGTPEVSQMNFLIGQLARRYRLPWRSSTMPSGSKAFDAQSGYESAATAMSVLLAGANYMWHAAGWDEAGMVNDPAKFVVDAEQCEMLYRLARGVSLDDFAQALAAVREVGPGGHFLGTAHTREHFQDAFFIPELLDNSSYEQWVTEGGLDTNHRARTRVKEMLAQYEAPTLDAGIAGELRDFIRRREAEIPQGIE